MLSLSRKIRLTALVALVIILGTVLLLRLDTPAQMSSAEIRRQLIAGRAALQSRDFATVEDVLSRLLILPEVPPKAYLLAGELAFHQGAVDKAVEQFEQIPQDGSAVAQNALLAMGDISFGRQDYQTAERHYLKVLQHVPDQLLCHQRLAFIYNLEGRRLESVPHLMQILRQRAFTVRDLCMLANMRAVTFADDEDQESLQRVQAQPAYNIGQARHAIEDGNLDQAQQLLAEAIAQIPDVIEAHVWMGRVHVLRGDENAWRQWNATLPSAGEAHPEVWLSRGLWELQHQRHEAALRCFWEGLRIDPNFATIADHFVEALVRTGRIDIAQQVSGWKENLTELAIISQRVYDHPLSFQAHRAAKAAELTEKMGRLWESCAWSQIAFEMKPQRYAEAARLQRLAPLLTPDMPRMLPGHNPIAALDFSDLPLPVTTPSSSESPSLSAGSRTQLPWSRPEAIQFVEEAQPRGIQAEFFFSEDRSTKGGRMYEFTGGGTAALDFDRDTLVDLYFTQGTQWPPNRDNFDYLDSLFRQVSGDRFVNVTHSAGVIENSFSQGVTIGDWNQDGFQDIYVGNIGRNRLFLNNGDGTFTDGTDAAGLTSDRWTTSVLMGDLNGDSFPELFDVLYVHDDDVYERICERDGEPGACSPTAFYPQHDQVFLNLGSGGVRDVTDASGISQYEGNGLGILMFRMPDSPRPRLLVANDMTANFFYTVEPPMSADDGLRLVESGTLSGVAYSDDGIAQACMGMALADADHDGQWDIFVTNFEAEYNTLYRPYVAGFFRDESAATGLAALSLPYVGFGTEFLDADLDTYPDLFIVNGHVDEFYNVSSLYEQPPQVLFNEAGRSFRELPGQQLGEYFRPLMRGRSLAKLDWNRDGRMDVATSNLGGPVSLVTNQTETDSHFVAFRFVATRGDREALTTVCRIETSVGAQMGQLTGGDGYQCTNERMVHFGLGPAEQVDRLDVEWPDGTHTTLTELAADRTWLIVQNRSHALLWPTPAQTTAGPPAARQGVR